MCFNGCREGSGSEGETEQIGGEVDKNLGMAQEAVPSAERPDQEEPGSEGALHNFPYAKGALQGAGPNIILVRGYLTCLAENSWLWKAPDGMGASGEKATRKAAKRVLTTCLARISGGKEDFGGQQSRPHGDFHCCLIRMMAVIRAAEWILKTGNCP